MSAVNENQESSPFVSSSGVSWRVIAGIVVAVVAVIFILQNTEEVTIDFLFLDFQVGMWFGLLLAFAFGLVVGWGLHIGWRRRQQARAAAKARND